MAVVEAAAPDWRRRQSTVERRSTRSHFVATPRCPHDVEARNQPDPIGRRRRLPRAVKPEASVLTFDDQRLQPTPLPVSRAFEFGVSCFFLSIFFVSFFFFFACHAFVSSASRRFLVVRRPAGSTGDRLTWPISFAFFRLSICLGAATLFGETPAPPFLVCGTIRPSDRRLLRYRRALPIEKRANRATHSAFSGAWLRRIGVGFGTEQASARADDLEYDVSISRYY